MKWAACLVTVASVALTGCVSPLVRPNALATQYKATNAVDWQSMATRTVAAIPAPADGMKSSVFVAENPRASRFYAIYQQYLEQELYRQNYRIVRSPSAADIILETNTEWVLHDRDGKKITDYHTLGFASLAYFGQFRNISSLDTAFAAGIATGVIKDFLTSMNGTTKAEVVVTTKLISLRTNYLHFLRSEAVYVEPSELTYYMDALPLVAMPIVQGRETTGGQ
jgi:hypothetical protein